MGSPVLTVNLRLGPQVLRSRSLEVSLCSRAIGNWSNADLGGGNGNELTSHGFKQPFLFDEGNLYDSLPFCLLPVKVLLEVGRVEVEDG